MQDIWPVCSSVIAVCLLGLLIPELVAKIAGDMTVREKNELTIIYLKSALVSNVVMYALLMIYYYFMG